MGRRKVHFQAPPADALPDETARFLAWANERGSQPDLIKAGLAHLWFVTLHPFDDRNGRIARAVGDFFWHAQTAVRSGFTACRRKSSVIARTTTMCLNARRRAHWM